MPDRRVIEHVHGILVRERVRFNVADDGQSFLVPVPHGSAAVVVTFHDWGRGQTMISLRAEVLVNVDVKKSNRLETLELLNALNQTALFGRFYLDADRATIQLDYDLLGDELDSEELMNALYTVGIVADETDDQLLTQLGTGERASDVFARENVAVDFDGVPAGTWTDLRPSSGT
jgi:hypothetical protein